MTSAEQVKAKLEDHFRDATKMVKLGSGAERKTKDYILSRFACYLLDEKKRNRKKTLSANTEDDQDAPRQKSLFDEI